MENTSANKKTTGGGSSPAPDFSGHVSGPGQDLINLSAQHIADTYRLMAESGSIKADEDWAKMMFWAKLEGLFLGIALASAIVGAVIAIRIGIGG